MNKPHHHSSDPEAVEHPEEENGKSASPADAAILKRIQEKYLPDSILETQDQYAKWLLGLTTTVAALGAGFSNAAFNTLKGLGLWSYGLAVLFAGLGISIATYSLSVSLPDANWKSLDEMFKETKTPLKKKRWSIRLAALSLALAIAAAGMAPILSLVKLDGHAWNPSLTYSIGKDTVECAFSSAELKKGTRFGLSVYGIGPDNNETLLGAASEIVGSRKKSSLKVSRSAVPADLVSMKFAGFYTLDSTGAKEQSEEIKVVLKPAPTATTRQ